MTDSDRNTVLEATNLLGGNGYSIRGREENNYDDKNLESISPQKQSKKSFRGTGNRCGHKPDSPRDVKLKNEEKRPFIIQKMLNAMDKLFFRRKGAKKDPGKMISVRSEGREGFIQISKKMVYNLELSTMTVCLNDITFSRPTLKDMTADSQETGLSYTRAKRAQRKLVDAGYLRVTRSPKYVNGEFKADPSEREVTHKFFQLLGMGEDYSFQKHIKTKRLEKRAAKSGFQRELMLKLKENLAQGKTKGVKTGSFPEARRHRANLINIYVNVCKRRCPEMDALHLRAAAEKMDIEHLENLVKYHHTMLDTS